MSSHDNELGGTYHSDNIQHHPFGAGITAERNDHRQCRLNNKPPKAPSQQEPSFQLSLPTSPSARSSVTSETPPTQTSPPTTASPNTEAASAPPESPPSTPLSPKWPSTTSTQQNHGQHRRKPNARLHRRQGRHRFHEHRLDSRPHRFPASRVLQRGMIGAGRGSRCSTVRTRSAIITALGNMKTSGVCALASVRIEYDQRCFLRARRDSICIGRFSNSACVLVI